MEKKSTKVPYHVKKHHSTLEMNTFKVTRGHARFARSPLVIRLGDSRIRLGDSGCGEVLSWGGIIVMKLEP